METIVEPTMSEATDTSENIDTWNERDISSERLRSFIESRLSAAALQDVSL